MATRRVTAADRRMIAALVEHFRSHAHLFEVFAEGLVANIQKSPRLKGLIHSTKYRIKDPDHLSGKIERKLKEAWSEGRDHDFTVDNLFEKVNDLAGVRLIHLHSEQMPLIHELLTDIFTEQQYRLVEAPTANVWDSEFEAMYTKLGIETRNRDSMYSTVHYVIEANQRTKITCEIQVRTLMDEAWGEVSHSVNYPDPTDSEACREQLRVLARFTTGCSRLVDSIFRSHHSSK